MRIKICETEFIISKLSYYYNYYYYYLLLLLILIVIFNAITRQIIMFNYIVTILVHNTSYFLQKMV